MNNPIPWQFSKPSTCNIPKEQLFALQRPFFGKRLNKSRLIRKISADDIKHSSALSALTIPIPVTWSWKNLGKTTFKGKIEQPRDQGNCGGCWAFSVAMALGDRYSIKYSIPSPYLSPLWLITKTYYLMQTLPEQACNNGGDPYQASQWLETNKIQLEKCWPYSMISNSSSLNRYQQWVTPNSLPDNCCSTCCSYQINTVLNTNFSVQRNSTKTLVVMDINYTINKIATIAAIQREIMTNGPVICGFQVYNDFMDYWDNDAPSGGIYVCKDDSPRQLNGGHAITITGWGVGKLSNGKTVRYWELRNTWGTYTGDGGYGRVAFSTDAPSNINMEMDIPKESISGGEWSGGMIALTPGPLPTNYIAPTTPKQITTPKCVFQTQCVLNPKQALLEGFKYKNDSSAKILGITIHTPVLIGIIVFILIILIILLVHLRK